jgi:hypothetical protein
MVSDLLLLYTLATRGDAAELQLQLQEGWAQSGVAHRLPLPRSTQSAASKHDHGQVCSGPAAHERTAHPSVSFPRGLVGNGGRQKHRSDRNIVTFNLAKIPLLFVWLTGVNDSSVSPSKEQFGRQTNKVIGPFVN